jgi:hypothetical protein
MWKHDKEAIAAVEQFNMTVDDILGHEGKFGPDYCMSMETNGTQTLVRFMGVVLWDSEDDERKADGNKYEPMLEFLERRVKEEIEFFSRLLKPKEE